MRSRNFTSMYATSFLVDEAHAFLNKIHSNSLLLRTRNREPFGPASDDRMMCVKEVFESHKRGMSTCDIGLEDLAKADTVCHKETTCASVRLARQSSNCAASRAG